MKKKKSEVLAEKLESLRARLIELDAIEDPSEEEAAEARAILPEFTDTEEAHRAAEAEEARVEQIRSYAMKHPEVRESNGGPDLVVRNNLDPFENLEGIRAGLVPLNDMRHRAMTAIESQRSEFMSDEHREQATRMAQNPMIARHILMTGSPEYHDDFARFLQDPVSYRGTALSLTDANGGYLVPYTLDPTIILTSAGSDNPFRRISRVESTATDTWSGVTSAGVDAEWLAEAQQAAEAGPVIAPLTITPGKAFAEITASYEILQDSNFASQLPRLLADAKDRLEEAAFATGDGTNKPKGIVTAVGAVAGSRVSPQTAATFSSASIQDVYTVINALPPRHRARSTWLANYATFNVIRRMDTAGGSAFWANLAGPLLPEQLIGLPIYASSTMTATVGASANILLCGDFSEYIIVDRVGMSVSYDANVRGAAGRHTGQGQFSAFWRVGADVGSVNAFRLLRL